MQEKTRIRLQLIVAKAQLLLADSNPWYQDAYSAAAEIAAEANKVFDEIRNDGRWQAGDR